MGKNVLIIGASGDIGIAIAERLAMEGYQLLLHYNQQKKVIDRLRTTLEKECILAIMQADLGGQTGTQKLLEELVYPVDYIVFASGSAYYGIFQETPEKTMDEMLSLHVKSPWMITRHLLPSMIRKKTGKIVFITSIWGDVGASYEVLYSAVKGAQNSFVKALAKEVAPSGISINAVSPGFIDTKMNRHLIQEEKNAIISEIPMNRAGTTDEIAHTVSFLLDRNSSYIQGEIIGVNGGW